MLLHIFLRFQSTREKLKSMGFKPDNETAQRWLKGLNTRDKNHLEKAIAEMLDVMTKLGGLND